MDVYERYDTHAPWIAQNPEEFLNVLQVGAGIAEKHLSALDDDEFTPEVLIDTEGSLAINEQNGVRQDLLAVVTPKGASGVFCVIRMRAMTMDGPLDELIISRFQQGEEGSYSYPCDLSEPPMSATPRVFQSANGQYSHKVGLTNRNRDGVVVFSSTNKLEGDPRRLGDAWALQYHHPAAPPQSEYVTAT